MLTAAKKCAMRGKTKGNIFLPSPREMKNTGKRCKKCKRPLRHIMYTRGEKGLSSPREGAKKGKNGQKREWETPVFRLNKEGRTFSQTQNIFAAREWTRSQIDKRQVLKENFVRQGHIKLFVKHRFYEQYGVKELILAFFI